MSTSEANGDGLTHSYQHPNNEDDKDPGQDTEPRKMTKINEKLKKTEKKRSGTATNDKVKRNEHRIKRKKRSLWKDSSTIGTRWWTVGKSGSIQAQKGNKKERETIWLEKQETRLGNN